MYKRQVETGLALAELIASISKPSATLVLGGGHSIGIPLAVSARHSLSLIHIYRCQREVSLADGVANRLHAVQQSLNSLFRGLIAVVDVVALFLIDAGACLLYTSGAGRG